MLYQFMYFYGCCLQIEILRQTGKQLARQNSELKRELQSVDSSFFDDIEVSARC